MTLKNRIFYDLLRYTPEQRARWIGKLEELAGVWRIPQLDLLKYGLIIYRMGGGHFTYVDTKDEGDHALAIKALMQANVPAGNPAEIMPPPDETLGRIR